MASTAAPEAPASPTSKSPKSVSIAVPENGTVRSKPPNQHDDDAAFLDPVAWPINRCCYEELKPGELSTIEQLFVARDDAPSFMKWVVLHKPPHAFVKRLLVLSSFRALLFKRNQTPFKSALVLTREVQLLHLDELRVLRLSTIQLSDPTAVATSIIMRFHAPKHHHFHDLVGSDESNDAPPSRDAVTHDFELHVDPGIHAETIVRLCQRLLHAMRLVFPGQALPPLVLPPTCPWQEFFSRSSTVLRSRRKEHGDAMATAYRCFCDDLRVPYRASVATRLRECLESTSVDVQHCLRATSNSSFQQPVIPARHDHSSSVLSTLARWVGLHAYSASAVQAKEALALARTIEHSRCFDEIVVYDLGMGDVALRSLFFTLLPSSSSEHLAGVKGLSLTHVGLTTRALRTLQHIVLQSSIRRTGASSALALRRLDLSFNKFSGQMAHGLATILELLPSGLDVLQLEQCRFPMLASARVLSAMKASHGFSSCLRELNLSGNTLGIEGTKTLSVWITGAFALHHLDLSRTRLQTNAFFQAFKQNSILHESSLVSLDLSYNRMGTSASVDLGDVLGKTQSLSTIVLRGMKQPLLHPRRILSELLSNKPTHSKLEAKRATRGLRTIHLRNIIGPMLQNSSRSFPCLIDLSENDLHGPKATALAHLLDNAPNAALASLLLDDAVLTDKAAVLLLHSLRTCKYLTSLGLDGNGFVRRTTAQSYKQFHAKPADGRASRAPSVLERAAADALSLLLGGKTTSAALGPSDSESHDSAHSFTHLYHHRPKLVPLRELSLAARGRVVCGEFVLTTAIQTLKVNATLQMLDVSGNECGDALARALGDALPTNQTLQMLYWDDNFTTVDGFFAFYDGLLQNHTLSVVQLPIRDTRRILEEQKDPPREKLFSVLGKIFKVTERNQSLALERQKRPAKKDAKSPRRKQKSAEGGDNQTTESDASATVSAKPLDDEPEEMQEEAMSVAAVHVDVAVPNTAEEAAWTGRYATRTRYTTTIQSWAREGPNSGGDDVRASWDQIGALASMLT